MTPTDVADKAKDKARVAADATKEKAREAAESTKEHPTRTGGIVAAVVGGLAAIWALRRKLKGGGKDRSDSKS